MSTENYTSESSAFLEPVAVKTGVVPGEDPYLCGHSDNLPLGFSSIVLTGFDCERLQEKVLMAEMNDPRQAEPIRTTQNHFKVSLRQFSS